MKGKVVLVIDDEKNIRESLKGVLEDEGYKVLLAESGRRAIDELSKNHVDVVLLDILLPDIDGIDLLRRIKSEDPGIPVVVMSGHGTIETAVKAIKLGAHNFLEKPLSIDELLISVENALRMEALDRTVRLYRDSVFEGEEFVAVSPASKKVLEMVDVISKTDVPVLIVGENGTGKGIIARLIHKKGVRAEGPFVEVQCSLISEEFVEVELFGCEASASRDGKTKKGKIELADGGTVFFDEVGDLGQKAQTRILRVIEERIIERTGGSRTIGVDVRVVASTRKDLGKEVSSGRFREDLYYRLNVVKIEIPPLRERREDIKPLVDLFMEKLSSRYGRSIDLTDDAYERLMEHSWPGNVRELRNTLERLFILFRGDGTVDGDTISRYIEYPSSSVHDRLFSAKTLKDAIRDFEAEFIKAKLKENRGNVAKTARKLGMGRRNLYNRIKALGIDVESIREE